MMTGLPARIEDLPASLIDIGEALGMRVALKLIQNYGGLEVKFPAKPRPDHPVIKALGETDAYALCDYLGGQAIYVPHGRVSSRRNEVLRLQGEGLTRAEIAVRLGISQRHVRGLANSSTDSRQGDLFD